MSQNVLFLIILIAVMVAAVVGTLVFVYLVDRSVERRAPEEGEDRRSEEDTSS